MKFRNLLRLLRSDGWYLVRTKGSHRQFRHRTKRGLVTVAGSDNDDILPRTLRSILRQAQLEPKKENEK